MKLKHLVYLPVMMVSALVLSGCDLLALPIATDQCEEILQILAANDDEERTGTYHGITLDYTDLYEGDSGAAGEGEEVTGEYRRYDNDIRVDSDITTTWGFSDGNDAHVGEEESTTEVYIFADETSAYSIAVTDDVQQTTNVRNLTELPEMLNLAQGSFADAMYQELYVDLYNEDGSLIDSNLTVSLTGQSPIAGGTTTITLKVVDSAFFDYGTIHIDAEMTIKYFITDEKLSGYEWQWFYKTTVDMDGNALGYTYIISEINAEMDISYTSNGDFAEADLPTPMA